MKVGIMQPYYFPYIGYWQLINAVDRYVIYDDVNYIKGGWMNRNKIQIGCEPKYFSLRCSDSSSNKLVKEVYLADDPVFIVKQIRKLEETYGKAPCFPQAMPVIRKILKNPEKNLAFFLRDQIFDICAYLGITTELLVSSDIEKDSSLRGQEKVLEICQILGATEYYNAIGGQLLYDKQAFSERGIALKFLNSQDISYRQFNDGFIKNLSIIDVMMFNTPGQIREMLKAFILE